MGDLDRALTAYERALQHNPSSIPGLTQVAGIARVRENYVKVCVTFFLNLNFAFLFFFYYLLGCLRGRHEIHASLFCARFRFMGVMHASHVLPRFLLMRGRGWKIIGP